MNQFLPAFSSGVGHTLCLGRQFKILQQTKGDSAMKVSPEHLNAIFEEFLKVEEAQIIN